MQKLADTKKVAEIIMNLDKSIIDTQRIALEARAISFACSVYIAKLPAADAIDLAEVDLLIDETSTSLEPLEMHIRQAAKSAVRTIYKQSILEKQRKEIAAQKTHAP